MEKNTGFLAVLVNLPVLVFIFFQCRKFWNWFYLMVLTQEQKKKNKKNKKKKKKNIKKIFKKLKNIRIKQKKKYTNRIIENLTLMKKFGNSSNFTGRKPVRYWRLQIIFSMISGARITWLLLIPILNLTAWIKVI